MIVSQSHDENGKADGIWLQLVNSATAVADSIVRGNICIWDFAATGNKRGIYCVILPTASANDNRVCGVAEDAFPVLVATVADLTKVGLVQKFGFHDAVTFTGTAAATASNCLMAPSATKGTAEMFTGTPIVAEICSTIGRCLTTSGTPATVPALLGGPGV